MKERKNDESSFPPLLHQTLSGRKLQNRKLQGHLKPKIDDDARISKGLIGCKMVAIHKTLRIDSQ